MNRLTVTFLALSVLLAVVPATARQKEVRQKEVRQKEVRQKEVRHFGQDFTDAKLVRLSDVMSSAEMYKGKSVKVEGEISEVCQMEGCWLVLTDGERAMRVKMKNHSFAVPKDSAGKKVIVEGLIEAKTISEAEARHYAEESSTKTDPLTIKGPQSVVTMIATGVRIAE